MASLQARLGAWLVASVALVAGLHWVVSGAASSVIAERHLASRLEHDAEALIAALSFDEAGQAAVDPGSLAPVYLRPRSGHYYQVVTAGQTLPSASLAGAALDLRALREARTPQAFRTQGPAGQPLLVWVAQSRVAGRLVQLAVAEDVGPVEADFHALRERFTAGSLVLLVVLVAVQRLVLRWSLRPLERVRDDLRLLETGATARLSEDVPAEVRPLVAEVNRLLGVHRERLTRSRQALANLAHAIKTPLTLLSHATDEAGRRDCGCVGDLREAVSRIQSAVGRELKRARLAGSVAVTHRFQPADELPALIGVLREVHRERRVAFEVVVPEGPAWGADQEDMVELFGNLLDNAAKWARGRVRVEAESGEGLAFTVDDDGPGVRDEDLVRLTGRGVRLDEGVPGHGVGLAVSRDIVEEYGGSMAFSRSPVLGGLRVRVTIPGSSKAPD